MWVGGRLDIVQHSLAGRLETFALALFSQLFGSELRDGALRSALLGGLHLGFDGLAFPASRHVLILPLPLTRHVVLGDDAGLAVAAADARRGLHPPAVVDWRVEVV